MAKRDWDAYWIKCWKLCLLATLGPWEKVYTPKDGDWIANKERGIISPYNDATGAARIAAEEADLEFVAESRTALPAWLQRAKDLEDALRSAYRAITDGLDGIPSEVLRQSGGSRLRAEAKRKIREVLDDVVD